MRKCFIFGALPVDKLVSFPKQNDFIIAADKGILTLEKFDIKPDVIIGDFDSLGFVPEGEVIKLPVRKDKTDVGYAIDWALEKGFREFRVYGAFGGKEDHTVANLQICYAVSRMGGRAYLFGDTQAAVCITNNFISLKGKGRCSVFAFGGKAEGVSIKGLSYCLKNAELDPSFPLGVSNSFIGEKAYVSVDNGTLLIIYDL